MTCNSLWGFRYYISCASKADGKTASAYRYKYETVLADHHRMLQDNEAGLDFSYDLNNLASLARLTLFLEEGGFAEELEDFI